MRCIVLIVLALQLSACASLGSSGAGTAQTYPFQDERLSADERLDDLIARLTLDEKVAQMYDKAPAIPRLGIPEYHWWNEALHGVARAGEATVFPQAIGLAASFDEDMVKRVAETIAVEARAKHHDFVARNTRSMYTGLTFWSPNINIFRDPRWGRGQETYGEDPLLTSKIATSFVNGLQGDDPAKPIAIATLKHYAVHSGPEPSRHSDDFRPSTYDLNATYLSAFERVIKATNVSSVMCAYNAVYGQPACASPWLLRETLRDQFGFDGYIVSDCGAIADIFKRSAHNTVETKAQAAAVAVRAGTDLECGDGDGSVFASLPQAIDASLIDELAVDQAVRRLFKARLELGLLNRGIAESDADDINLVSAPSHQKINLKAARKAFVMLKNDGVLPLRPQTKIAVVGPNSDNPDVLTANYHGTPVNPVTPLEGLIARAGDSVSHAVGSPLAGDVYTHYKPVPASEFSYVKRGKALPGLRVDYFDRLDFNSRPVTTGVVENIDMRWRRSPINGKDDDDFGVRFSGFLTPSKSGYYRFGGDVSVTLDEQLVTAPIRLEVGKRYYFIAEKTIAKAWHSNAIQPSATLSWIDLNQNLLQDAADATRAADVIVFIGGISAKLEGEEMHVSVDGFLGGDRTSIDLPASQRQLLARMQAQGKPIVFINFSGSAIDLSWAKENAAAVIQGFYPGEATGTALAEILYGEISPSGRLPVTFYSGVEDLPAFRDYSMAGRTYKYYSGEPVYTFGAGIGYATVVTGLISAPDTARASRDLKLRIELSNQSEFDTDEVLQLYVEPTVEQAPALHELKQVKVVPIPAGQTITTEMVVTASDLRFIASNGEPKPYSGPVRFRLGGLDKDSNARIFDVEFR